MKGANAIANHIDYCIHKPQQFLFVALATGTAVQANATSLRFTTLTFYGMKAVSATAAPTANAADAYVGVADASNVFGNGANLPAFLDTVSAGGSLTLRAPVGSKYDLKDFYFLGTTGDKIAIGYEQ